MVKGEHLTFKGLLIELGSAITKAVEATFCLGGMFVIVSIPFVLNKLNETGLSLTIANILSVYFG